MSFFYSPPVSSVTPPGGASGQVQYNSAGSFAGAANFVYAAGVVGFNSFVGTDLALTIEPKIPVDAEVGGTVRLRSPAVTTSSSGNLFVTTGNAANRSGAITVQTGNTTSTSQNAGVISLIAGNCTSAIPGNRIVTGGATADGSGILEIRGGNPTNASASPGSIFITPGISTGGVASGVLYLGSSINFALGITSSIGGSITQLAFFNQTPIARPTTSFSAAAFVANASANIVYNESTFDGYTLAKVVASLRSLGLLT